MTIHNWRSLLEVMSVSYGGVHAVVPQSCALVVFDDAHLGFFCN